MEETTSKRGTASSVSEEALNSSKVTSATTSSTSGSTECDEDGDHKDDETSSLQGHSLETIKDPVARKREYNRRCAAKSRKKRKMQLMKLEAEADETAAALEEAERTNEKLRKKVLKLLKKHKIIDSDVTTTTAAAAAAATATAAAALPSAAVNSAMAGAGNIPAASATTVPLILPPHESTMLPSLPASCHTNVDDFGGTLQTLLQHQALLNVLQNLASSSTST